MIIQIPRYCQQEFLCITKLIYLFYLIYLRERLSMQIENFSNGNNKHKQNTKCRNPKRHNQEALLTIDITPKKYRGMIFLGNFSSAVKHNIQQTPELKDPRLSYLDYAYFTNKKVLDVGSGEGLLTIQIAIRCFPAKIIALDIDNHLLEKLKKKVDTIVAKNVLYSKSSQVVLKRVHQLPLFFQQEFEKSRAHNSFSGSKIVEIMTEGEQFKSRFPDNLCFYNENFMNIQDKQKYDTLLLMKTSKWMHLSFGDKGLTSLFQKAFQLLVPGGILILEYPLYRSYKKKKSLNNLYQQNMKDNIHIDPLSFPNILEHIGFSLIRQIQVNFQKGLKHPIAVLIKNR